MLLLLPLALAHVPHPMVAAIAPAPDLDDSEPWWALAVPYLPMLYRSDDGGLTWTSVGGEPVGDWPTDLARTDSGTLVVVGAARYWWSDDGVTWDSDALPARLSSVVAVGEEVILAGAEGVWSVVLGERPVEESAVSIRTVSRGPAPVATGGDGLVYRRSGSAWAALDALPGYATAAASDGQDLYAGADDGSVWRWLDGAWVACDALPDADAEHAVVVAVVVEQARVLVGTGNAAPYTSTDRCLSWSRDTAPVSTDWASTGAPESEREVVVDLFAHRDRVAWGGWSGLWTRADDRWTAAALVGTDFTRGAVVASAAESDTPRVYLGSYGGGLLRSDDSGQSWTGHNNRMTGSNVQDVQVGAEGPDTVYALSGHYLNVSIDGGGSTGGGERGEKASAVSADAQQAGEVWAQFDDGLALSTDAGTTWSSPLSTGAAGSFTRHLRVGDELCAFFQRPFEAMCAPAPGGPWTPRFAAPADPPSVVAGLPTGAPEMVVAGIDNTVVTSTDAFRNTRTVLELVDDQVVALAVTDNNTIVAASLAGLLLASADRGTTWIDTGLRLHAAPWSLAPRPGFSSSPEVVVATLDGPYLLRDPLGDATIDRFAPFQRIDDASEFWELGQSACRPSYGDPRGEMGTLRELDEGCVLTQWIRGSHIRVLGIPGGAATLTIDDDAPVSFGPGTGGESEELAAVETTEGWHRVELRGLLAGVQFDALDASGTGALLSPAAATEPATEPPAMAAEGCEGCAQGPASGAAGAAALGLVFARRAQRPGARR